MHRAVSAQRIQWKAFTEQTKELTELATKSATNVMKGLSS